MIVTVWCFGVTAAYSRACNVGRMEKAVSSVLSKNLYRAPPIQTVSTMSMFIASLWRIKRQLFKESYLFPVYFGNGMNQFYNPLFLARILKRYLVDVDRLDRISDEALR